MFCCGSNDLHVITLVLFLALIGWADVNILSCVQISDYKEGYIWFDGNSSFEISYGRTDNVARVQLNVIHKFSRRYERLGLYIAPLF